jgi:hypothetical protein
MTIEQYQECLKMLRDEMEKADREGDHDKFVGAAMATLTFLEVAEKSFPQKQMSSQ